MIAEKIKGTSVIPAIDLLSAWIEAQMAYRGLPGMSVALIYDQEVLWARGFGYQDINRRIPATEKTLYRVASITKLFTATSVMILRDAGKLDLDDRIKDYLPWFKMDNSEIEEQPISIRQLITHTSGLPREADFPYWTDSNFPEREAMIKALPGQKPALPALKQWKYSNLALSLAGEIVSVVSGVPYTDFVEANIYKPLNMSASFIKTVPFDHPDLAVGYGRRLPDGTRTISPFGDLKAISPAANMTTSVEDLAKFAMLQIQANSEQSAILKPSTLREMHRVQWLEPDWKSGWGLGFGIARIKDRTLIGHGGALEGYRTQVNINVEDKVGAIVFTNADDGMPAYYVEKFFEWVAPEVVKAFAPKSEKKLVPDSWKKYTGRYRSVWGDMQILIYNDELIAIDPTTADPMLAPTRLVPVGEHTFKMDMKYGIGGLGELVIFELNDKDEVVRVKTGDNYSHPIKRW